MLLSNFYGYLFQLHYVSISLKKPRCLTFTFLLKYFSQSNSNIQLGFFSLWYVLEETFKLKIRKISQNNTTTIDTQPLSIILNKEMKSIIIQSIYLNKLFSYFFLFIGFIFSIRLFFALLSNFNFSFLLYAFPNNN